MPHPRGGLVALLGGVVLAGCGLLPGTGPAVHLENITNTPLAVHVNGVWVGTYAAGSSVDVPLGGTGQPPYRVIVLSPSGAELAQFEVSANDIESAAEDLGGSSATFVEGCGTIRLSFGPIELDPVVTEEPGPGACP